MLPAGLLGDRYGRKKILLISMALFGIGSVACAYSTSVPEFMAARVLLGLAGNGVTARLPIDDVVNNDLQISASFSYTSAAWAEVTALLGSGRVRLAPLITHRFPLDAYEEAFEVLRESSGPRGKVMLDVNPEGTS